MSLDWNNFLLEVVASFAGPVILRPFICEFQFAEQSIYEKILIRSMKTNILLT